MEIRGLVSRHILDQPIFCLEKMNFSVSCRHSSFIFFNSKFLRLGHICSVLECASGKTTFKCWDASTGIIFLLTWISYRKYLCEPTVGMIKRSIDKAMSSNEKKIILARLKSMSNCCVFVGTNWFLPFFTVSVSHFSFCYK